MHGSHLSLCHIGFDLGTGVEQSRSSSSSLSTPRISWLPRAVKQRPTGGVSLKTLSGLLRAVGVVSGGEGGEVVTLAVYTYRHYMCVSIYPVYYASI